MIVAVKAFAEVAKALADQLNIGCDGMFIKENAKIEGAADIHFAAGITAQVKFLEKHGGEDQSPFVLRDVRDCFEAMHAIRKGKVDIEDFLEVYWPPGLCMDVGEVIKQRQDLKELTMRLDTLKSQHNLNNNSRLKHRMLAEIIASTCRLCATHSGKILANRLWDHYLPEEPKLIRMLISPSFRPQNCLLPAERDRIITKDNRRKIAKYAKVNYDRKKL